MSAILQAPWGTATATPITQAGHGFTLGQQVYFDGTSWQLAIATDVATLRIATVAQVVDANRFLVMFEGAMEWPGHGLTLGTTYYLSDTTPGEITPIPPAPAASLDQPCVKPITPDFVRLIDYVIIDSAPVSAFPTGTIAPYAGQTGSIVNGWLLCDGSEQDQAVFPDLYAVIQNIYGVASAGFFRLPDLRGRQLVMADHGANRLTNDETGAGPFLAEGGLANDMVSLSGTPLTGTTNAGGIHDHNTAPAGSHNHSQTGYRTSGRSEAGFAEFGHCTDFDRPQFVSTEYIGDHTHTIENGGAHEHSVVIDGGGDYQTRPESVTMNYLIKT